MKSSAPTAIALTLLMFLLVSAAALFFLFQGQQSLKGDLQEANESVRELEKQQAQIELNNSAAQATMDTLALSATKTAAENVDLTGQLANSDQLQATLDVQDEQLRSDLNSANATVTFYETSPPIVKVVGPQEDAIVTIGQPVELVIVATDHADVASILFNIGEELLGGPVENPDVTAIERYTWRPDVVGPVTISITATNMNGITSEPTTINLTVIAESTSTPEPTVQPTPEATTES